MVKRYKYLIGLIGLTVLVSFGVSLRAQQAPPKIKRDTTFSFPCRRDVPIDLNQAMGVQISHTHGYWGDKTGKPFTNDDVSPFAKNNLFNAKKAVSDSTYNFYFYFTSSTEYCGMSAGDRLELEIRVKKLTCYDPRSSAPLSTEFAFCYGTNRAKHDVAGTIYGSETTIEPMIMEELVFSSIISQNQHRWKKDTVNYHNSDWLDFEIYTDSLGTMPPIGNNKTPINTSPDDNSIDHVDTVYLAVTMHDGTIYRSHGIKITIYRQSTLTLTYTPDVINDKYKEYDINEDITIKVDDESFNVYKYYFNNKYLNDYYLGGRTNEYEITLPALIFTGLDDIIKVAGEDSHGCFVQATDNVVVSVPFPNAFTPDGDGVNDVFLGGEKFRNREFHLEIFNRWGNRLYYGEDGWDGTYQGNEMTPGEYGYVVKFKTPTGEVRTIRGFVTLLRKRR